MRPHAMTTSSIAAALSVLSFLIALGSFIYTMRTYAVTHRPYVGIIEHEYQVIGSPPAAMIWRFVLKNVGTVPARVTVDENKTTVRTEGRETTLPLLDKPGGGILLMPGQTADLQGQLSDAGGNATVHDIFSGRTQLDVRISLRYESAGHLWWPNRYYYRAINRLRATPVPPGFFMVSGEAD